MMKNQNIGFIAIAFVFAFALAPVTGAKPSPEVAQLSRGNC